MGAHSAGPVKLTGPTSSFAVRAPLPRSAELDGLPQCFAYSGNDPKRWLPGTDSHEVRQSVNWGPAGSLEGVGTVATDGCSRRQGASFMGG